MGEEHRVRSSHSPFPITHSRFSERLPAPAPQFPFPIPHHPFPAGREAARYCATAFTVGYLIPSCSRYVLYFVGS